jgi:catechol 2,3-dioxygenase-like lactoylglutathione lyase family enzyme
MAALLGPDFITLLVRDLDASREFYAQILGLPESPEKHPNAVAFETKPCGFAVRKAPEERRPPPDPNQGIILWFRASDAVSLNTRLKERGVPITSALADGPFGKTFVFRDPDGYLITVHDGG